MGRRKPDSRTAKPDRSRLERRRLIVGVLCFLWFGCVAARLYYLQIIQYVELLSRAQRQQQRTIEVAPQRGAIYDRQVNPLAMSLGVDSVFAVPSELAEPQMVASLLAPVLGVDADELRDRFQASHSFCWVKRRVTTEEAARVRQLNLKGLYFQRETKRFYPKGDLAAQAIGYVGLDDKGLGGIEYALDDEIKGKPGRVMLASDARRRTFHSTEWAGVPGKNVVLTLDEKIQYIAEKALAEEVATSQAVGGVAMVQNPNTGEILALANQPTFNPNNIDASSMTARLDRAAGWIYEPGSTFKVVTLSAALEENLTNPQEVINCQNGSIVLSGHTIHDHKPYGDLSVTDVLANSSDVGSIKLGLRLGEDRFYRYIQAYGFGAKTDLELPGEERGLLQPPSHWSGISIGEISIGQEIGVTPLQMISVYSAIANGGILFQPRIVHDVFLGAHHDALAPATGRRVVSAHTAEMMRQMLAAVVDHGTGKPAQLGGYTSAGKTGTAQKIDASRTYSKSNYVASFIGFAPAARPAVTILVVIDSPAGAHHGTDVAAPVFRSIAEQTLGYLNVPQDNPTRWPQIVTPKPAKAPDQKQEDFIGFLPTDRGSYGAATSPVQPASFSHRPLPDGSAPAGPPDEGVVSSTVVLGDGPLVTVPDFSGWSARRVAKECEKLGLDLNAVGSGLAVEQNPVAGVKVPSGTRIWVRMTR
ncbi:MAG: penicillin-binding protein [Terriglobia bacterium]|jgi:cell division protein FtsI (penicillin-binding protein 3)